MSIAPRPIGGPLQPRVRLVNGRKTSGSGHGPAARKPGPRGPAAAKYRRDLHIFREYLEGRSGAALAREYGLTARQIRQIVSDMREAATPPAERSPEQIIDEVIVRMEEAMRELAEAREGLTGAAQLKAISAYLNGLEQYFRLHQRAGRIPSEPGQWRTERDIERTVEVILDVFERYQVPIEAQREIRDLLDGRGKALEAG
jgi:hypothetical protein